MDSKTVNRELRRTVRPLLKKAGFNRFTDRNAWRYSASRVDVLNFQSFNSHLAGAIGATTFSFSLNLGSFMLEVPPLCGPDRIKVEDGHLLPQEYECPLRGRLHRGFDQPELKRNDTWYIDPKGKYLEQAVQDVCQRVEEDALPWFERLRDTERVLQILMSEPEDNDRLWGFGGIPSPVRSFLTGYVALALGRKELAAMHLQAALASNAFPLSTHQLKSDLATCRQPEC